VVGLGIDSLNNLYNDFQYYDPSFHTWTTLPSLPSSARKGCSSFFSGNNLYICNGIDASGNRLNETWKISLVNDIDENDEDGNIRSYPNPAASYLTLKITDNGILETYSPEGKLLRSEKVNAGANMISTTELENGIYFIKLKTKASVSIQKILVQK
jgi:hypothetical protein